MTQSSYLSSTVLDITVRKLENLGQQEKHFQKQRLSISDAILQQNTSPRTSLVALIDAIDCQHLVEDVEDHCRSKMKLNVIKQFLVQAEHDPCLDEAILSTWKSEIEASLGAIAHRYSHAVFFGKLVIDWMKSTTTCQGGGDGSADHDFEELGHGLMYEHQREWEQRAFMKTSVSTKGLVAYLDRCFERASIPPKGPRGVHTTSPLEALRLANAEFKSTAGKQIDAQDIRDCIRGILGQDLYAGPRRQELIELQSQESVLDEMADVLMQNLALLDNWRWESEPLQVHFRRAVNTKYRVYIDEEFHQAILLHWIGKRLSNHLETNFKTFFEDAWYHRSERNIPKDERDRLEAMVPKLAVLPSGSIAMERKATFRDKYWLAQLPELTSPGRYEDEGDDGSYGATFNVKQGVLRLVTTEMQIGLTVYEQFAIVQSDFKWFGPSLPHESILTIAKYLGISTEWVHFLSKFLQPMITFSSDEKISGTKRSCGIPMSHNLSTVLGEMVLFCLDTAVNQATNGGYLYRIHDDLWYWGRPDQCATAWQVISQFAHVTGLQLNEEKTGSALLLRSVKSTFGSVSSNNALQHTLANDAGLPPGAIRWGFLKIDEDKEGWVVDESVLREHITLFKTQLEVIPSILGRVRAWNLYIDRFIAANVGRPATCLGREHTLTILQTFEKLQGWLFEIEKGTTPNAANYFRHLVHTRTGLVDCPEALLFFPNEAGGLSVHNPAVRPGSVLATQVEKPSTLIDKAKNRDFDAYESAKERWEALSELERPSTFRNTPFPTFEEAWHYPEDNSRELCRVYKELQSDACPDSLPSSIVEHLLKSRSDTLPRWMSDDYWRATLYLYGDEVVQRFGCLDLARKSHLPLGAIRVLTSEKVRWQN